MDDDDFLTVLDGMIEATMEFIADDKFTAFHDPEGRVTDLGALSHVRQLFLNVYAEGAN